MIGYWHGHCLYRPSPLIPAFFITQSVGKVRRQVSPLMAGKIAAEAIRPDWLQVLPLRRAEGIHSGNA